MIKNIDQNIFASVVFALMILLFLTMWTWQGEQMARKNGASVPYSGSYLQ